MGALNIGRVGLDIDVDHPAHWQESRGIEEREFTVSGFLRAASVEETKTLRAELLEQQGQLVAVTYSLDDHFDGFYILGDVRIETVLTSYRYRGLFPYEVNLFRIGSDSRVEFQSNLTGTVLTNDHGLEAGEVTPWFCPPADATPVDWAAYNTSVGRNNESGWALVTLLSAGDFTSDATWGSDPALYYNGACRIYTGTTLRLRSGLDVTNTPSHWSLDNGMIRISPEDGTNTGRIKTEVHDGTTWESAKLYNFKQGGTTFNLWDFMSISRNSPEAVTIRLSSGTIAYKKATLDLHIRRGAPLVFGVFTYSGPAGTMEVDRNSTEAATTVIPAGATSAVGIRATSNDAGNNRYVMFTPQAHTADTTNGGLSVASTTQVRFCLGYEVEGSGASTYDAADQLALQYFGWFGERVRAVWR